MTAPNDDEAAPTRMPGNKHSPESDILKEGAFGNPDATRADLGKAYVDMQSVAPTLAINSNNFISRMFVGRKGSGKTFHLRDLQISASQKADCISFDDTRPMPDWVFRNITSAISTDKAELSWQLVWRRAVFSFLASIVYCKMRRVTRSYSSAIRQPMCSDDFFRHFGSIFDPPLTEITPVQYVQIFANKYNEKQGEFRNFLEHKLWVELENVMADIISDAPPIFIFIDALDNDIELIPRLWYDSQLGLYLLIFELLGSHDFGNRLHIMTTVRDVVYRNILRSTHASRLVGDRHMRMLNWGFNDVKYFFLQKIRRIPTMANTRRGDAADPLRVWLGIDEVYNPKRRIKEAPLDYILRHTRAVPRDIVIIGNRIIQEKEKCEGLKIDFKGGHLRKCIEDAARLFGNESVNLCASEMLLHEGTSSQYKSILKVNDADIRTIRFGIFQFIKRFVEKIGRERFSREQLDQALSAVYPERLGFFDEADVLNFDRVDNVLWRNGLIACLDDRGTSRPHWTYVWYSGTHQNVLPERTKEYGFHPSLIDLWKIENSGGDVVY